MSDWCEETTLAFLEAYKNEECLWNAKHSHHKNRKKVNDAWIRISSMMQKPVKDLKNKKEILMATFRRHLKRKQDSLRSGAGPNEIYKPIWYAYDLMESFLVPHNTCTKSIKTEEVPLSQETEVIEEETEEHNLVESSISIHMPKLMVPRRRPASDLAEQQMTAAVGQLTEILSKRRKERSPPPQEDDECDLYAKLLAKKLRELSSDERKLVMYDIDTIFVNGIKKRLAARQNPSP